MDTHVSFLETNCSVNASHQPNPGVPDGHGRLPANVDAVGSWCCTTKFSVSEWRWNFSQLLQMKQVKRSKWTSFSTSLYLPHSSQLTRLYLQNIEGISSSFLSTSRFGGDRPLLSPKSPPMILGTPGCEHRNCCRRRHVTNWRLKSLSK